MLKRGLLGVLLVGLLSVTLLQPVRAQALWCYTVDFTETDGGFITAGGFGYGTWIDGVGWEGTTAGTGVSIYIGREFDPAFNMTHIEVDVEYAGTGDVNANISLEIPIDEFNVSSGTYEGDLDVDGTGIILNPSSGESQGEQVTLTRAYFEGMGDNPFGENDEGCGEEPSDDWIRPLLADDENTVGGLAVWDQPSFAAALFDGPVTDISNFAAPDTQFRVMAMSNAPGAPVLAAQSGTVTNIEIYSTDMCSVWGLILSGGTQCWFGIPTSGAEAMGLYQLAITGDLHQVTIQLTDGNELRYLVYNAGRYVHLNQEINAGCVIGETIQAEEVPISEKANAISTIIGEWASLGGPLIGGTEAGFGITFVEERNPGEVFEMVQLLPKLTAYNETAYPCNLDANFQDCLIRDSDLTNQPDDWETFGDVQATEAGLDLRPNSHIQQVINLPEGTTFSFRIGLYFNALDLLLNPDSLTRQVRFRVGTFETTETIEASGEYQEYVVEVPELEIDPYGFGYTVRIANTGGADTGGIIIAAACLSTDDHTLNPRACYFQNYEFDTTAGWTTTNVQQGNGFIILANADAVLQEVQLTANEDDSPRTYRLEVDARPIAAPGATLDTDAGSATLYYSWGDIGTIGALDLQWNQPGNPGYPDAYQTFSIDIEVSELTTDDFIIYTGFVDNATVNIALSRVCLSTDTDTPTGGGVPGPFKTSCNTIPVPTEDSFGLWTMYHWRNLDKFFTCKLMVLLNKWYKEFDQFRRTMLLVARWWIAMANKLANWASSLLYWLNGHFRNIAVGQVTTIDQGGGGPGIWDVLLALINGVFSPLIQMVGQIVGLLLAIISQAASLLLTVLTAAISFIILLVGQFLSLFALGKGLLEALLAAYANSTAIPIPMLPTCHVDPTSGLCPGFWILDNTILSGSGVIIVPIMVAIGSIHLILWVITSIRRNVLEVSNAT